MKKSDSSQVRTSDRLSWICLLITIVCSRQLVPRFLRCEADSSLTSVAADHLQHSRSNYSYSSETHLPPPLRCPKFTCTYREIISSFYFCLYVLRAQLCLFCTTNTCNAEFHTLNHYKEKKLKQAMTSKLHINNWLPHWRKKTSLIMFTIPWHRQGLYMIYNINLSRNIWGNMRHRQYRRQRKVQLIISVSLCRTSTSFLHSDIWIEG